MIPFNDGEKAAKELGCPFFEASATTGENVEFIFRTLNTMLVEHSQKKKTKISENEVKDSLIIDGKISGRGKSKRKAVSKKKAS